MGITSNLIQIETVKKREQQLPTLSKHMELDFLPSDWSICALKEIGQCIIGLTYEPKHVTTDGLLVLRSSNIGDYALQLDDSVFVNMEVSDQLILREDDLLICVRNGSRPLIGKCTLIDHRASGMTFGAFMSVFRSDDNRFLFYCFQSDIVKHQIHQHLGATINQITNKSLHSFMIPYPNQEERNAITEVLSNVDGLIKSLEALIAKKSALKQATTQQLLTGKTRLPGFSGEWETKRLEELGSFSKGRGIKRQDVSDVGIPCIRYGELYTQYKDYVYNTVSHITSIVALESMQIRKGDLLFAGSGETAEEIGICAAYLSEEPAYAGGDIIILTPSGQNSIYLGHLMNHSTVAIQKTRMGQGDAVVHISPSNLAKVKVLLPPLIEQTAIAAILTDMDSEIAILEQRWKKTLAIKQGMIQQLLTGRVRLITDWEANEHVQ